MYRTKQVFKRLGQVLALQTALISAGPALAELEIARDLMEAGKFEQARHALWPAARSGNAEAEELIGVMYAMGLGVEQDFERAFDWYLRSAMKGHPGAQRSLDARWGNRAATRALPTTPLLQLPASTRRLRTLKRSAA